MPLLNFHIIVAEINLYAGTRGFGVHAPNSVKPLARIHSGRSRTRDERVSIPPPPHRVMREHTGVSQRSMHIDFPLAETLVLGNASGSASPLRPLELLKRSSYSLLIGLKHCAVWF
jgi:hypothetical protein